MMHRLQYLLQCMLLLYTVNIKLVGSSDDAYTTETKVRNGHETPTAVELPRPLLRFRKLQMDELDELEDTKGDIRSGRSHRLTMMDIALQASVREGIAAMAELYGKIEPEILRNGQLLAENHPAALLSKFSAPLENTTSREMAAYAAISATKAFKKNYKRFDDLARQAHTPKISLRRTALEGLCTPRDPPICTPASERYRTHDGTCNNQRRLRWGAAQMPFNRFLPPEYGDGVDTIRTGTNNLPLSSSRFVSLLVHGAKDGDAPLTLMTAQWGQLLDHDMTSTAQPRSINGSVPSCCGGNDFHPSCFPIKVPLDDPWLAPLKVRCLEFLRSAPAQRRDCVLSWREQTNQATSFIDASPIYSSSTKSSDNARAFRNGQLIFGRGNPAQDVCQRGALARQCIRSGDGRSGEQPGLLALHHVWVGEHNRIANELSELNLHWSDEKIYQEARRIVGAMFQHITYREFLPIVLGREVCKLFELDLQSTGYYDGYDPKTNPTVANSFSAAAFRFGHSLIQNSYMRCDRHHNRINNSVSLHEEFQRGDIGSAGSLHRLLRGLATQRALKRDEFISPELTNHLFQTPGFPFGLDLAAINIQRGRDHGIAPYTSWRVPCGLTPINSWNDFANIVGPESAKRIGHAYRSVHDIDLFVGGISERPVVGGLVGPTFACIIAQQFSNSRKGDRFWYENRGLVNSFTPAQLHSIRRVSLAQVLCRTVGSGTFQPNIFIPHVFPGNERLPCGTGPLAPIDLGPWLEQDPFGAPLPSEATMETIQPDRVFDIISDMHSLTGTQQIKEDKTGFNDLTSAFSNNSTLQEQHMTHSALLLQRPLNASKINDKLDFKRKSTSTKRPTPRPIKGVNNKLDQTQASNFNIKSVNHAGRPVTTTRRTVVINNIPIELRTASPNEIGNTNSNSTKKEKPSTGLMTDKKKKKNKNANKTKGRADNVYEEQNDVNVTTPQDEIVFDQEHTDLSQKTTVDEIVFDDRDIFAASKKYTHFRDTKKNVESNTITDIKPPRDLEMQEKTDNKDILMTKTILAVLGTTIKHMTTKPSTKTAADAKNFTSLSKTLTDEKPSGDIEMRKETNNKEILVTKTNSTALGVKVQNKTITKPSTNTTTTIADETNVQDIQIFKEIALTRQQTEKFSISNDIVKRIPLHFGQNLTSIKESKINQQSEMEQKMTYVTVNDKNSTQKGNSKSDQRLKKESTITTEIETNPSFSPKNNPDTNQQLKTETKISTDNETVSLTTQTEDITKTQTLKTVASLITEKDPKRLNMKLNIMYTSVFTDPNQHDKQTPKQLKDDTDIDPLTHSTAKEHKRVQRKVTNSNTKTEQRNVTNPKLLRANITSPNIKLMSSFKLFSLINRTISTTKVPKQSKTTESSIELRQYQTRPIYTRPQKVYVEGPNSDQYEIEINIRQTNKAPAMKPTSSYADYTTAIKPFGYDRYTNYGDYRSTTPAYPYYQPDSTITSNFFQGQRTRPPTIIYLDEHDERTTTKQPSLLQNFLSFAASGFGANRRPTGSPNTQKENEKPIFSHNSLNSGSLSSTLVSSPHNSASSSQFGSEPQRLPIASSSFSHVGTYPGNGGVQAASGAISSGNFGSIMGIANANGADSIFSFNIRPRPPSDSSAASLSNPVAGSYGLVPPRRPEYAQLSHSDYNNLPIASYPSGQYFAQQTLQASHSPFSTTGNKKPLQQSYFNHFAKNPQVKSSSANEVSDPTDHKIDVHDFDYLSKTVERGDNDDDENDSDDLDTDYEYDDVDQQDNDEPSKKFNRDGYIRPEFMIESLLKNQDTPLTNITSPNNTNYLLDDNFVLPVLNSSKQTDVDLPTPIAIPPEDFTFTQTTINPTDSLPKNLNNDISAEDYDDIQNHSIPRSQTAQTQTTLRTTKRAKTPAQNVSFAPITILTKPERPDNWVIYETPEEKPLLPEIPEIKSDTFSASEVPMPFAGLTNAWINKYRNQIVKDRDDSYTHINTENLTTEGDLDVAESATDISEVDDITDNSNMTETKMTTSITNDSRIADITSRPFYESTAGTEPSMDTTLNVTTDKRPDIEMDKTN